MMPSYALSGHYFLTLFSEGVALGYNVMALWAVERYIQKLDIRHYEHDRKAA